MSLVVRVTAFVSPYDVYIAILLYMICYEHQRIPAELVLDLLAPTVPSKEYNPILMRERPGIMVNKHNEINVVEPTFEAIYAKLKSHDLQLLAQRTVSLLNSLQGIDSIAYMFQVLERDCLVSKYNEITPGSTPRKITTSSLWGKFLQRSALKFRISGFEERNDLWRTFVKTRDHLKMCCEPSVLQNDEPDPFQYSKNGSRFISDEDHDMIAHLGALTRNLTQDEIPDIIISGEYLQFVLNQLIYAVENQIPSNCSKVLQRIIDSLVPNDISKFPSVHILRYLEALNGLSYQTALDLLHNYFDYMLTKSPTNCFHISLLCLAKFHAKFNDCEAAIKTFEEATRIARENKDTKTLNLIMVWIIDFIETKPAHAKDFQVTVDQIVKYLKTCPDSESATIFENAYKFEFLLAMMINSSTVNILEASLKNSVIVFENSESKYNIKLLYKNCARMWQLLGYKSVSHVYDKLSDNVTLAEIDIELDELLNDFDTHGKIKLHKTKQLLNNLESKHLTHEQRRKLQIIEIRYLTYINDYNLAMEKICLRLEDCNLVAPLDSTWLYMFQKEYCHIMQKCDAMVRATPLLMDMINTVKANRNPLQLAECSILFGALLKQLERFDEYELLIKRNLRFLEEMHSSLNRTMTLLIPLTSASL